MGKVYYCVECNKDYEFIRTTKSEKFKIDDEKTINIECLMDVCPVCGNGFYINPNYKEIEAIINKRRQEKQK